MTESLSSEPAEGRAPEAAAQFAALLERQKRIRPVAIWPRRAPSPGGSRAFSESLLPPRVDIVVTTTIQEKRPGVAARP
jgi:hypothetical protein